MNRLQAASCGVVCVALALSGCQSWSQMSQSMPTASRVPPPGTGTYQVPSSYYNNQGAKTNTTTSTTNPQGNVRTASASAPASGMPGNVSTAAWTQPTVDQMRSDITNSTTAAINNLGTQANQAIQSGTTQANAAIQKLAAPVNNWAAGNPASSSFPTTSAATGSLSDGAAAPTPSLNWQQPQ